MRVTLYVCGDCGSINCFTDEYGYCDVCKQGPPKPIVFAPLPSEETRYWIKEAAESGIGCRTCDWTHDSEMKIGAALSELTECWSDGKQGKYAGAAPHDVRGWKP